VQKSRQQNICTRRWCLTTRLHILYIFYICAFILLRVSSCNYICFLILLCVLIGGAWPLPQYICMRPHTTHATMCVLIQLYMFPRATMCPHRWCATTTPIHASSAATELLHATELQQSCSCNRAATELLQLYCASLTQVVRDHYPYTCVLSCNRAVACNRAATERLQLSCASPPLSQVVHDHYPYMCVLILGMLLCVSSY